MELKVIDIHSHINFTAYDVDRDAVIKRSLTSGIGMINVGTQNDTSKSAVELAEKYKEGVYATVGLHPIHAGGATYHDKNELSDRQFNKHISKFDYEFYKNLARNDKVVAIGECGLDYFRLDGKTKIKQKDTFIEQIHLANELKKPLMLHIRNAYDDALDIIKSESKVLGNCHFFAGTLPEAKKFIELGFTISFTGVITFTHDYDDVIKNVPLNMIMVETDAPYVTPTPHRGRRNESAYVVEVLKQIADVRGADYEDIRATILANTKRVFNIQ